MSGKSISIEVYNKLEQRVKSLELRNRKADQDKELIDAGFRLDGHPPIGQCVLCKYSADDGELREQFFEKYEIQKVSYQWLGRPDNHPYAWKEICCDKKTKSK